MSSSCEFASITGMDLLGSAKFKHTAVDSFLITWQTFMYTNDRVSALRPSRCRTGCRCVVRINETTAKYFPLSGLIADTDVAENRVMKEMCETCKQSCGLSRKTCSHVVKYCSSWNSFPWWPLRSYNLSMLRLAKQYTELFNVVNITKITLNSVFKSTLTIVNTISQSRYLNWSSVD